jgi:hypothetical protein
LKASTINLITLTRIASVVLVFLCINSSVFTQLGGSSSFQFLELANSSRIQGLGGKNISLSDSDVNLTLSNPALLDSTQSGSISINYHNYIGDINYGYSSYTHHVNKIGTFNLAMMYANYGKFKRADASGQINGNFVANDLAFVVGYGRAIDSNFRVGANFKFFNSIYDIYYSNGIALDLAASYHKPNSLFSAGMVIQNIGFSFAKYTETESLPLDFQLGMTYKLRHAPFRFSLTLANLQQWDLTYIDPLAPQDFDPNTFEPIPPDAPNFFDKAIGHIIFSTEIVLSKNFNIQLGYNVRRRQELKFLEKQGMVGFSGGVAFKVKKFHLNYCLASYHLAGNSHSFSITTNIHDFRHKN